MKCAIVECHNMRFVITSAFCAKCLVDFEASPEGKAFTPTAATDYRDRRWKEKRNAENAMAEANAKLQAALEAKKAEPVVPRETTPAELRQMNKTEAELLELERRAAQAKWEREPPMPTPDLEKPK